MPRVGPAVVEHLVRSAERAPSASALVPSIAGRAQPLCALYRPDLLPVVGEHLLSDLIAKRPIGFELGLGKKLLCGRLVGKARILGAVGAHILILVARH